MELYLGWRRYSTSDALITSQPAGTAAAGGVAGTTGVAGAAALTSFKDIDVVTAGARIKF